MAVYYRVLRLDTEDHRSDHEVHEERMQTGWWTANAGSRLKPLITQEGTVVESQPSSRTEGKPAVGHG
jgi:hypothetical protein